MKNENQQLEICQNSCRRLVEKQVETTARIAEIAKTLKQTLIDWEDDDVCSPHRVHHALAGPMAKIIERLYHVAWDMEDMEDKEND